MRRFTFRWCNMATAATGTLVEVLPLLSSVRFISTRRRRFWLVACGLKTCARFIFILLAIRPFPPGYDKAWVMLYVSAFSSAAVNSLLQMIGSLPCSLLGVTSGFSICIHPFAKSFRENILTINPPQWTLMTGTIYRERVERFSE